MEPAYDAAGPADSYRGDSGREYTATPEVCCEDPWEAAFLRFETPEEEIRKFHTRLVALGARAWPRDAEIVELFCGRGNGLHALAQLGFNRIEGMDLSANLIGRYWGSARCIVGDCRRLPFDEGSKDFVIVQGGLHHLLVLPDDLEQTLAEIHRVLRDGGSVVIVEPWMTPFLAFVHLVCKSRVARRLWAKLDAYATICEHERATLAAWLSQPRAIRDALDRSFEPVTAKVTWGKLRYVGKKRQTRPAAQRSDGIAAPHP
jgi:SAM-dependent methyltransferase